MPLLHRHYKIARTETRCHLLLKIRQMATQTSASRDYVLFSSGKSATRKFLNCLMICGHSPWSAPNLERHGSSRMQTFGWLEMPHFLNRISIRISIWNPTVWSFDNITCQSKEVLYLLRQFHSSILKLIPSGLEPRGRVPVQRLPEEASRSVPGSME